MTKQHSYNAHYFHSNVMEPLLSAIFPNGRKPQARWLSAKLAHCTVHRSKASENFFAENDIVRLPYLVCNRDLAPSDFWLFGHTNGAVTGQQFTGPADLLDGIRASLDEIQKSKLEHVFYH
jgi:hypothetical protein